MRVLIHCNGGPDIGVGHVMRSLALAEEAVASGHEVTFVGEYDGAFVLNQLDQAPVAVRRVARSDTSGLATVVRDLAPDVIHLDTYEPVHLEGAGALVSNVEDAHFGRRPADLVVDPNFGAEGQPRDAERPRALLRGSRYAPLRAMVIARRGEWQLREEATRVLVVMGGADPVGLTPNVLSVLAETGLPLHVTAIVPPTAQEACQAAVDAAPAGMQVDLVPPVEDLPALMAHQDLVVSAAGTSVLELCCLAVPTALVCAVDNQLPGYSRVVAAGAAIGLGQTLEGEEREPAVKQLRAALENPATRQDLSRQAAHLVDGLGAWRIVRAWEQLAAAESAGTEPVEPSLHVRRATMADAETLLRWRNDPATRAASRQKHEVTLDQHLGWLEASLQRDDRLLLVASDDEGDVGTVRWDRIDDGEWEVSITVAPERRGRSLARPLLHAGERFLADSGVAVAALVAGVHEDNPASRRLFERSGYLVDAPADDEGFLTYRKALDA